ncbi:MAG: hypothetical protein ACP5MH_07335 [Thermoproteus sp.]
MSKRDPLHAVVQLFRGRRHMQGHIRHLLLLSIAWSDPHAYPHAYPNANTAASDAYSHTYADVPERHVYPHLRMPGNWRHL